MTSSYEVSYETTIESNDNDLQKLDRGDGNKINEKDSTTNEISEELEEIFDVPEDSILRQKFPLKNKWDFYYLKDDKDLNWIDRLMKVYTFDNLGEFIAFLNEAKPPSLLKNGSDYNLFKNGIKPLWEEDDNVEGGRAVLTLDKSANCEILDNMWKELMLALASEHFADYSDSICGAVCNIRNKGSKISIWTKNSNDEATNKAIARQMVETILNAPGIDKCRKYFESVRFEEHKQASTKSNSSLPPKILVYVKEIANLWKEKEEQQTSSTLASH
uniref:EIF-4F 25 kDa subunit n=1 Tax=Parastrongyloides trichosuri TaxID=131310 RepID=A0A0N4ZSB6_PARTI